MSRCPGVPVCPGVSRCVLVCPGVSRCVPVCPGVSRWPGVPVSRCLGVPVSRCPGVPAGVPVSRCLGVPASRRLGVPVSWCPGVSVSRASRTGTQMFSLLSSSKQDRDTMLNLVSSGSIQQASPGHQRLACFLSASQWLAFIQQDRLGCQYFTCFIQQARLGHQCSACFHPASQARTPIFSLLASSKPHPDTNV